jgi:hypothetical protein
MHRLRRTLRFISSRPWSQLRSVTNSSAAKLTILVPILGYWILFNESARTYLKLVHEVGGSSADVSSRILVVYVGLVFVAAGAAIYQFKCPPDVKHFGDPNAYVGAVSGTIRDYAQEKIIVALLNSEFEREYIRVRERYENTSPEAMAGLLADNQMERLNKDILYVNFDMLNESGKLWRRIVGWLYLVGFGLLLLSSATVLGRIVWLLMRRLIENPSSFF